MRNYIVFRRSAKCWVSFASANKTVIRKGLTLEEARRMCAHFNDNRTPAQERRGTKYEFCQGGDL